MRPETAELKKCRKWSSCCEGNLELFPDEWDCVGIVSMPAVMVSVDEIHFILLQESSYSYYSNVQVVARVQNEKKPSKDMFSSEERRLWLGTCVRTLPCVPN